MIRWYSDHIVPKHRVLFVFATALLGVAGSFVADAPWRISNWLPFIGLAMGMYATDVCNEIELEARALVLPGRSDRNKARYDALMSKRPRIIVAVSAISVILTFTGFALGSAGDTLVDRYVLDQTPAPDTSTQVPLATPIEVDQEQPVK
jgi:hypothetical protein